MFKNGVEKSGFGVEYFEEFVDLNNLIYLPVKNHLFYSTFYYTTAQLCARGFSFFTSLNLFFSTLPTDLTVTKTIQIK